MRSAIIAIALLSSTAAFADAPVGPAIAAASVKSGAMLRDANNFRLGTVSRVNADGSLGLIIDSKFVTIPADSISIVDGKAQTKLTKREIISMR